MKSSFLLVIFFVTFSSEAKANNELATFFTQVKNFYSTGNKLNLSLKDQRWEGECITQSNFNGELDYSLGYKPELIITNKKYLGRNVLTMRLGGSYFGDPAQIDSKGDLVSIRNDGWGTSGGEGSENEKPFKTEAITTLRVGEAFGSTAFLLNEEKIVYRRDYGPNAPIELSRKSSRYCYFDTQIEM